MWSLSCCCFRLSLTFDLWPALNSDCRKIDFSALMLKSGGGQRENRLLLLLSFSCINEALLLKSVRFYKESVNLSCECSCCFCLFVVWFSWGNENSAVREFVQFWGECVSETYLSLCDVSRRQLLSVQMFFLFNQQIPHCVRNMNWPQIRSELLQCIQEHTDDNLWVWSLRGSETWMLFLINNVIDQMPDSPDLQHAIISLVWVCGAGLLSCNIHCQLPVNVVRTELSHWCRVSQGVCKDGGQPTSGRQSTDDYTPGGHIRN